LSSSWSPVALRIGLWDEARAAVGGFAARFRVSGVIPALLVT
jgi:hypothetical protein